MGNSDQGSSENYEEHISNKEISIRKNRSSESNFCKKEVGFDYFHPLTEKDISLLQSKSGRDFNNTAINEILKSLANKYPNHSFANKSAFMSYMAKALKHEMRDSEKVSNISFRIKGNYRDDFVEKYLRTVEESVDVSSEGRLRRKIAGVLTKESAYNFLRSFASVKSEAGRVLLVLSKDISLESYEQEKIINESRSVYGDNINVDLLLPEKRPQTTSKTFNNKNSTLVVDKERLVHAAQENIAEKKDPWSAIRTELITYIGPNGAAIDRAWFSKIEHKVDFNKKVIQLSSKSAIIVDWVKTNYWHLIERACKAFNYKVEVAI